MGMACTGEMTANPTPATKAVAMSFFMVASPAADE
jgi:hypothetical protein